MVNRITKFVENIQNYMDSNNANIDIFNCLFSSLEENGQIVRKNNEVFALTPSSVSKIMNGQMDVPKCFINAAKSIAPNDIFDDIENSITKHINVDDQKRLISNLAEMIVKDDYYSAEEKNDIAQCCLENDCSMIIANVFLLLLRKVEVEKNTNSQITINSFINDKVYNSLKIQEIGKDIDEVLNTKQEEIEQLYKKINEYIVPKEEPKQVDNNLALFQIGDTKYLENSIFDKVEISKENKDYIEKYAEAKEIKISKDFFVFKSLKESKFRIPGQRGELRGSSIEKDKYNSIQELYWKIMDFIYLFDYKKELAITHCVKLAISNSSYSDDSNVTVKLLFPKNSLFKHFDYSFDNNDSANLFLLLYDKYFDVKETINYEVYKDRYYIETPDISFEPNITLPFYSKSDPDVTNANRKFSSMNNYEFIDDKKYDIIKVKFEKIRKNSTVLMPTAILLLSKIKRIDYIITSDNILGEKQGVIK